ncbi:MAG: AmmeMemoRadiSam system protein B [Candidatus Omnitrophica bacterium]|nr:AmmeMemoRadiSam system protein B [Candidatus Omnitrophota bacterium]
MNRSFFLSFVLMAGLMMGNYAHAQDDVKQAGLAGSWYPAGKLELAGMLNGFWAGAEVPTPALDIGVIVSPHAGLVFSGPTAAYGFKAVQSKKVSTVIVLAPTHHFSFTGASIWAKGAFVTPLGSILVDEDLAAKIMAENALFSFRKDIFEGKADRPENSIETQLPFIQKAFPQARIVPVIMGYPPDPKNVQAVALALAQAVGDREDVLIDVSVDQSHFHPLKDANAIDRKGLAAIEKFDIESLWNGHVDGSMEVDGFHVVTAAMMYAKARGYDQARVLKYGTSADTTHDASSVVGYASIAFYKKPSGRTVAPLSADQKARLLQIARSTLDAFVKTGKAPSIDEKDARLSEEEGAFVTLKIGGQLRGCIGNIIGDGPLYKTVRDMAVAAASEDPRFSPVKPAELAGIDVEVSVLSRPRLARSVDEIVMGTHGVIVRKGGRGGVFLPQVATETGWSKERFMSELCSQKAGLPADCWKDPATRLEIFTADVFGEKEH